MDRNWDVFAKKVRMVGKPFTLTAEDCVAAARRLGLTQLPTSYCDYMARFGAGSWSDEFTVFCPFNPTWSISLDTLVGNGRTVIDEWIKDKATRSDVKDPERMDRLLAFGNWSSGYYLAWDRGRIRENGEMDLFLVSPPEVLEPCGATLLEFLDEYLIGGKLDTVCRLSNNGTWRCNPVFKTWSKEEIAKKIRLP